MTDHIICYDIACPRRLGRIHRQLKKRATPLQYSVFLFSGSQHALEQCLTQLQALIDPRHDDLRAYPLPQRGLRLSLGRHTLPEGIYCDSLTLSPPTDPHHPSKIQPPEPPMWAIT